jgi:hypothetical protein
MTHWSSHQTSNYDWDTLKCILRHVATTLIVLHSWRISRVLILRVSSCEDYESQNQKNDKTDRNI